MTGSVASNDERSFVAKGWKNGRHDGSGSGYGLKISPEDRDRYFRRDLNTIQLKLPTGVVTSVNVGKSSFWNDTCRELISADIGRWLLSSGLAPWPDRKPPDVRLFQHTPTTFEVASD
jgi:hypothetical protein